MNPQDLDRANINNLTHFWKHMGAEARNLETGHTLYVASPGINRIWFDWACETQSQDIDLLIKKAIANENSCMIPIWGEKSDLLDKLLRAQEFELAFKQRAMVLRLGDVKPCLSSANPICSVKTKQEIKHWCEVASQIFGAFGESISPPIIERLLERSPVHLVMALRNEALAGIGLVYEAFGVAGIHYIGVLPAYRGQGIAHQIMNHLIHFIQKRPYHYATLQASDMAENWYHRLGFVRQFTISNFCRSKNI